jgi:hypothetical protein
MTKSVATGAKSWVRNVECDFILYGALKTTLNVVRMGGGEGGGEERERGERRREEEREERVVCIASEGASGNIVLAMHLAERCVKMKTKTKTKTKRRRKRKRKLKLKRKRKRKNK